MVRASKGREYIVRGCISNGYHMYYVGMYVQGINSKGMSIEGCIVRGCIVK